jgi:hypothetical protein
MVQPGCPADSDRHTDGVGTALLAVNHFLICLGNHSEKELKKDQKKEKLTESSMDTCEGTLAPLQQHVWPTKAFKPCKSVQDAGVQHHRSHT